MKNQSLQRFFQAWGALEKRLMPGYVWRIDPLTFWRERVLFILCFITTAFGIIPLVPSVILSYQEGVWSVILLDSCAYAVIVVLLINRHWPLRRRGYIACLVFYWLGAGLLFILGPQGAGYIWLFGASIMISSIVGLEAAIWILVINTLTLISVSFYAHFGQPYWAVNLGSPLQKMLVLTVNFLFFNSFATITLGFMLNGLKRALEKEQQVSANLRKSEERYRIVADFNYDWEYWVGPEGALAYVSPSCERVTGHPVDAFMKDPELMLSIVHPVDQAAVAQHLKSDMDPSRDVDAIDFRIVTADGQIKWISHYCQPVFAAGGTYLGRRASNRDITDRKTIEDTIRLHHERFLTVLDSIDASIYVADMQTYEILFMNKHMIQSYGKDMTGSICWQVLRNGVAACNWCVERKHGGTDGSMGGHSWQEQNPVTQRWYVNYDRFIRWTDGRPAKIQIATDITELKKMEAELRQTHKMEAIGTLAGGIAHDFNNILSAIIGYTELALDDASKGTLMEANLQEVFIAGQRARDLVRQILAFARQSDEKVKPLMVNPIAKEALKLIRSSIPSSIQIRSSIVSDSTILGNPTQVHQILMNLCTNAAHAMEKKGGLMDVDLRDIHIAGGNPLQAQLNLKAGDYLQLCVSDTGEGIPPEIMNSIFEPYFTTKGPGEGTGMGLAMVQGIVESYGGKIAVRSEPNHGSTFTVYLPISSKRSDAVYAVEADLPMGNERILFVDDEVPIVKMGTQILERLGYKVTSRTSSLEALALFRSRPHDFDLVITDMTMPQMSGERLAGEMMHIRKDVPVILCTGYSKQISDNIAAKIGIKAFTFKPIIKKDLAMTIRKVLDSAAGDPESRRTDAS